MDPVLGPVFVSLITIIPTIVGLWLTYRTAKEGRDHAAEAVKVAKETLAEAKVVHTLSDGLMDKYIVSAKAKSHADGMLEGRAASAAEAANLAAGVQQGKDETLATAERLATVAPSPESTSSEIQSAVKEAVSNLSVTGTVPVTGTVEVKGEVQQLP